MMAFQNEWHRIQLKHPKLALIIFTDPGVDDALMLLQILCARKYPIAGIIPVAGNVDKTIALKNAEALCALANREDVLIYPGSFDKITPEGQEDIAVYGESGLGGIQLAHNSYKDTHTAISGIAFAANLLQNTPCVIISTAILTEPAFLLQTLEKNTPEALKNIVAISMMGGVINATQEANWPIAAHRTSEANVAFDAGASQIFFNICQKYPIQIFLSSLDLTHKILASQSDMTGFVESESEAAQLACKLICHTPQHYKERYRQGPDKAYRQPLHDLHATHCLLHSELYNGRWVTLSVSNHIFPQQLNIQNKKNGNVFLLDMHYSYRNEFFCQFLEDLEGIKDGFT